MLAGCALAVAMLVMLLPGEAAAQLRKTVPNDTYYLGFGPFYDGDFKSAQQAFREAGKSGFVSVDGRWIDSICFHTMLGESYYHMGDMTNAADQYSSAVKLFIIHRDWMLRAEFPQGIDPEQNLLKTTITWGRSTRATKVGHFSDRYQTIQGNSDAQNQAVLQTGGVVSPPQLFSVGIAEICRCTALALSRRAEILGPASQYDPLTIKALEALLRRPGPPNHWSQCWIELQLGCAYVAAGKTNEAISELTRSLQAGGQYDHPLTCVGLLELGKIAYKQGKYDAAQALLLESTYSAAFFERWDVMEEAFRYGTQAHIISGQKGVYPPLVAAAAWAKQKRVKMLNASLLISLAENLATNGETSAAAAALNQAKATMNRTEMTFGQMGGRLNLENARVQFQAGNVAAGNSSLTAALTFQKAASKRLFQIGLIDGCALRGEFTERVSDLLYTEVLREQTNADWIHDPLDTLAVLSTPHPLPYEHWLEICISRKEQDRALEIADRIRRHRFFSTLPLGGRLLALRWVLEAPLESLTPAAVQQRQDLRAKYPKYAELSQQAAAIQKKIDALPLVPMEDADKKQQTQLLVELAKVSTTLEIVLQQIALRREPSDFTFPPLVPIATIQQKLSPGSLVVAYLATSQSVHAFAISKQKYAHFRLADPGSVKNGVVDMLRLLGMYDRNQPLDEKDLLSQEWQAPAANILSQLTNNMKPEEWQKYDELIVVPDGVLWYVPFEALQTTSATGEQQPLASLLKVRYAPTVSLAVPDGRGVKPLPRTGVIAGKLLPRDGIEVAATAADQLVGGLPGASRFGDTLVAPSALLSSTVDRLVVLSDLDDSDKNPYALAPMLLDKGKPGSSVADWFALPFHAPEQMVLPGFHSAAESSLKRGGTGDEIFLSVCGLMSTGTRTVLLSRWRPGGQTAFDLVREFTTELPHSSATNSWHRAVQLARASEIDPAKEPRVKLSGSAESLKAEHPFFWAGYLLVDSDSDPAAAADAPAPKAKAAEKKEAEPAAKKPAEEEPAEEKPAEKKEVPSGKAKSAPKAPAPKKDAAKKAAPK